MKFIQHLRTKSSLAQQLFLKAINEQDSTKMQKAKDEKQIYEQIIREILSGKFD
jgi:hypothetical protein